MLSNRVALATAIVLVASMCVGAELEERAQRSLAAWHTVVQARCRRAAECGQIHPDAVEVCVAAAKDDGLRARITAGLIAVSDGWAAKERLRAETDPCAGGLGLDFDATFALAAFEPRRRLHERCLEDEDCVLGRCADLIEDRGGLCKSKLKDGEACERSSECAATSFCRQSGNVASCTKRFRKGQRCSSEVLSDDFCEGGLECRRDRQERDRCLPPEPRPWQGRARLGMKCDTAPCIETPPELRCVGNLYCRETAQRLGVVQKGKGETSPLGRCAEYRTERQRCDEKTDLRCGESPFLECGEQTHQCARVHQPGARCAPEDPAISFMWCDRGTLRVQVAPGQSCTADAPCAGRCAAGHCRKEHLNDADLEFVRRFSAAKIEE